MRKLRTTYEATRPWVTYTYGRTHDGWWPLWNSTRVLGRARIGLLQDPLSRVQRRGHENGGGNSFEQLLGICP